MVEKIDNNIGIAIVLSVKKILMTFLIFFSEVTIKLSIESQLSIGKNIRLTSLA